MTSVNSNGYILPVQDLSNSLAHTSSVTGQAGISTTTALVNGTNGTGLSYTGGQGGVSGAGGVGGDGGSLNFLGGAGAATNGNGGCVRLGGGLGAGTGGNGGVITRIPDMVNTTVDATGNAGVVTAKQLLNGYIAVGANALGGYTITTPTGTQLSNAIPDIAIGDSFVVYINNTVAQTMTWTAGVDVTVLGTATLTASLPSKAVFICTGAHTWVTFLLKN